MAIRMIGFDTAKHVFQCIVRTRAVGRSEAACLHALSGWKSRGARALNGTPWI
jgi:hypothetical protein